MAVVSGSTLKTNMATVETALDTLVTTPNQTNYDALITALNTVVTDAQVSRGIATTDGRRIHNDVYVSAKALRREAQSIASHYGVTDSKLWSKLKRSSVTPRTAWTALRTVGTSD